MEIYHTNLPITCAFPTSTACTQFSTKQEDPCPYKPEPLFRPLYTGGAWGTNVCDPP